MCTLRVFLRSYNHQKISDPVITIWKTDVVSRAFFASRGDRRGPSDSELRVHVYSIWVMFRIHSTAQYVDKWTRMCITFGVSLKQSKLGKARYTAIQHGKWLFVYSISWHASGLAFSSALMMEASCAPETSVDFYRTTRLYTAESWTLHFKVILPSAS
jgi:hypothetical protein